MDRRSALKNIAIATGSVITLPTWMVSCGVSDTDTHTSSFKPKHQEVLAAIADTIIPAGNAIGALSVGADKFIQKIIDDCHEPVVGDNARAQLSALDKFAEKQHDKPFADCTQQQRVDMLMKLDKSTNKDEKDFYHLMKTETIRAFNTSQQVLEGFHGYKVAPGFYNGCVPVQAEKNA